jgi:hypothetical protein
MVKVMAKMLRGGVGTAAVILLLATGLAVAQVGDAGGQTFAMGNGRPIRGTVTAATPTMLTVKTEAGDVYEVLISPNTQVRKGRDPMKAADIKPGDGVGAIGEMDPNKKAVHALMVTVVTAEDLKKAREAMGKTFISGTVTAINDLKLTIKRTDDVVQVIAVDEDTSFKKGARGMAMALGADGMSGGGRRGGGAAPAIPTADDSAESLTLADVKVGSVVAGPGTLKNGVFVPTTLAIGDAAAQRQRKRPDGAGAAGATPAGTTQNPATQPGGPPSQTPPGSTPPTTELI